MHFICASGLDGIEPSGVDTIVCAGMGGDLIRKILTAAPWIRDERYTLILQPQSGAADFRKWLFAEGFSLLEENPVWEDGHMYFVMKLRYTGAGTEVTPGRLYLTEPMLRSDSEDLPRYIQGVLEHLEKTINGMQKATKQNEKLDFYLQARQEITEMRDSLGKGF